MSDDNEDEGRSERRADMIEQSALLEDTLLLHILKPVLHTFCCTRSVAARRVHPHSQKMCRPEEDER